MARMPAARWLGEHAGTNDPAMDRYDIVCVHTIVGWAPAHAAHFSVHLDGAIDQSRDTRWESDANFNGNHRVIAIENEDGGEWWKPLTPEQVEANGQILRWAHETHGIPLRLAPDSRPGSRGLAPHRWGIDGNFGGHRFPGRVPGGEVWTEHYGKECPGDAKIAQLPDILAVARGGNPSEDDMSAKDVWDFAIGKSRNFARNWSARTHMRNQSVMLRELTAAHRQILTDIDDVLAAAKDDRVSRRAPERREVVRRLDEILADLDADEQQQ